MGVVYFGNYRSRTPVSELKVSRKQRLNVLSLGKHAGSNKMGQELLQRITIDPSICHGKPCVRGLRYPVETLLELLASGMTNEEILADYEDLTHEDILACLAYAARLTQVNRISHIAA